jgi:hypothetical protein
VGLPLAGAPVGVVVVDRDLRIMAVHAPAPLGRVGPGHVGSLLGTVDPALHKAIAAAVAGFAAAGAWTERAAWWTLLVAVVLTWLSGLDYARSAPRLLSRTQPQ